MPQVRQVDRECAEGARDARVKASKSNEMF